jgi:hypothetical protein
MDEDMEEADDRHNDSVGNPDASAASEEPRRRLGSSVSSRKSTWTRPHF